MYNLCTFVYKILIYRRHFIRLKAMELAFLLVEMVE